MKADRLSLVLILTGLILATEPTRAEVRYYQDQNGVTWREETATVQRPVRELAMESREEHVYRPQDTTTVQHYSYLTYAPVVQYQWVPRVHGWWRIWQDPDVAYHLEPTVAWQPRPYQISLPLTQRQWVADKRTVQVPVARLKMVEKEETIRTAVQPNTALLAQQRPPAVTAGNVAVSPMPPTVPPAWTSSPPAAAPQFGGIARLDDGLPRAGVAEGWHPLR